MKEFKSLSAALEFCELSLIRAAVPNENGFALLPDTPSAMGRSRSTSLFRESTISMENVLKLLLDLPAAYDYGIKEIVNYCKNVVYPKGSKFFQKQDRSKCFFVLLSGLADIRYAS